MCPNSSICGKKKTATTDVGVGGDFSDMRKNVEK